MKKLKIFLKGLFGFCQADGCHRKSTFDTRFWFGSIKKKSKLCEEHAIQIFKRDGTGL